MALLTDLAVISSGKRPPLISKDRTDALAIPVVGGGGISGFTNVPLFEDGAIVTGRVGTLGQLHVVAGPCWPSDNALVLRARDGIDPDFLRFALSNKIGEALGMNRGAANPLITQRDLGQLEMPDLSPGEQVAVGKALRTINDKIELNQQMNETLDAMAQAIFRDWFVDFGPVRRKAAGETDPVAILGGLIADHVRAAELGTLFPTALDGDGRPQGWPMCRVEDLLELAYGRALPKQSRRIGDIPVYGSGGIGGWHDEYLEKGPSIVIGRKGTVGSIFWEPGPFFAIDTTFYVKARRRLPLVYLWSLLKLLGLEGMNTDAAVPGLNRSNVYRLEVPAVPRPLIDAFGAVAGLLRQRIDLNDRERSVLSETRNYLLPRLMSGEVKIRSGS